MKKTAEKIYAAAGLLLATVAMQSCSMETPFSSEDGVLQVRLAINSNVTRAAMNEQDLADNCVVYISNSKGLVFKEKGLSNLPDQITLRQGSYVAEAWTGDSVPASFDSKFYRCYEPFEMVGGVNELHLTCKIANVVASVNANTIDDAQVKDIHVTVASSNGSLEFDNSNFKTAKGYFMMPFDKDGNRESELTITIEGENILGEPFTKEKKVANAKPGYEYIVNLTYGDSEDEAQGGGYLVVTIDERETLVASTVEIFAAPSIQGVDFDIEHQIIGEPGEFVGDRQVKVVAFDEIKSFIIECQDAGNLNLPAQAVDLKNTTESIIADIHDAGIDWDKTVEEVEGNKDGHVRQLSYLTFTERYLNSLPARDNEYRIGLTAVDGNGKMTKQTLRIAVGENAIVYDAPVVATDVEAATDNYMAIGARRVTVPVSIKDETSTNVGVRYREAGAETWNTVLMKGMRSNVSGSVTLTGLKPATRYEYKAVADGYEPTESMYFTTEGLFTIPNASLEEWSDYSANSKVLLPGVGGERTFWDSGNHGSATMSVTLTQSSTDMFHSGSVSACLRSQFVGLGSLGKFAAGNLFAGEYYKTNGTNGEIYFGREYNGSHPSALKVFVNYRPGVADKNGSKGGKLNQGDQDKGQIYVALTTEKVHIDTRYPDTMLWDTDADCVLAYGEKLFEGNYGPDGQLQELTIPINYNTKAKTRKPVYLVIVCTASYYGDYFDGGEGSTMYVDDFELVYE